MENGAVERPSIETTEIDDLVFKSTETEVEARGLLQEEIEKQAEIFGSSSDSFDEEEALKELERKEKRKRKKGTRTSSVLHREFSSSESSDGDVSADEDWRSEKKLKKSLSSSSGSVGSAGKRTRLSSSGSGEVGEKRQKTHNPEVGKKKASLNPWASSLATSRLQTEQYDRRPPPPYMQNSYQQQNIYSSYGGRPNQGRYPSSAPYPSNVQAPSYAPNSSHAAAPPQSYSSGGYNTQYGGYDSYNTPPIRRSEESSLPSVPAGNTVSSTSQSSASTTGTEEARQSFKKYASKIIVNCVTSYNKEKPFPDKEEFKNICRKLTHKVMDKEKSRKSKNYLITHKTEGKLKKLVADYIAAKYPNHPRVVKLKSKRRHK